MAGEVLQVAGNLCPECRSQVQPGSLRLGAVQIERERKTTDAWRAARVP